LERPDGLRVAGIKRKKKAAKSRLNLSTEGAPRGKRKVERKGRSCIRTRKKDPRRLL